MAVRLSVRGAEQSPGVIDGIRQAYRRMQGIFDDRGYDFFAALHGLSAPIWCQHGTALFLPWHRAYLYYFELALQTRLGQRFTVIDPEEPSLADIGLPWWDWTSPRSHSDGLPASFADPDPTNPLFGVTVQTAISPTQMLTGVWSEWLLSAVRNSAMLSGTITSANPPKTLRDPDAPGNLPTAQVVNGDVLQENTYDGFWNKLEDVHDDVHGWVGGAMSAVPTSAYDPIFWSHHAMIDRLWYLWQLSPLGVDPPTALLGTVLAPFPMTVADTLDIANMGYEYAVQLGV